MIVVDTNVASEIMRPSPAPPVRAWLAEQPARELYTTAITVAEVGYGIARLPDSQRKELLAGVVAGVFASFSDHLLPFRVASTAPWFLQMHAISASNPLIGVPACSWLEDDVRVLCRCPAVRNLKDFDHVGIELTNPWDW
jgi:toxin FitB